MAPALFRAILGRPASAFLAAARARGVRASVARRLERAALQLSPDEPGKVLESRELFEGAAIRTILADGGNLELSFRAADQIAMLVDQLGLARSTDLPDPFRRVWVTDTTTRRRAVVLMHGHGELAIICPLGGARPRSGSLVRLSYRGFTSAVEYALQVSDVVLLPHGIVLHLTRADGQGTIGRSNERYAVNFRGELRAMDPAHEAQGLVIPCDILDISRGGLRLEGGFTFGRGDAVIVDLPLRDGVDEPLHCDGVVLWVKELSPPRRSLGVEFTQLSEHDTRRLARFLKGQALGLPATR